MGVYTSPRVYASSLRIRIEGGGKKAIKEARKQGVRMKWDSQRDAPVNSGETKSGIKSRATKMGSVVKSKVSGSFKQNLFANRSRPFEVLNFKGKKTFIYDSPQTVRYGGSAKTTKGKTIRWTGVPGFFTINAYRTRRRLVKKGRKAFIEELRK